VRGTIAALALAIAMAPAPGASGPARAGTAEEEFAAGEADFRAGDSASAESRYRRALEMDPGHLRALLRLATVVSWDGRLGESAGLYDRALALEPGSREARLGRARVASWAGDFRKAREIYEAVLAGSPSDREARLGLARTHAWAGRHGAARDLYLGLLSDDPGDLAARNGLAAVLSWDGKLDDALALYEETLAIDPANREARAGRARVLMWQGRTAEARRAAGEALAADPGNREAARLDAALRDGARPEVRGLASRVHDTDRNVYATEQAVLSWTPAPGATAEVAYTHMDVAVVDAFETTLKTVRGSGSVRLGRDVVGRGGFAFEHITHRDDTTTVRPAVSAGADWRLSDAVTLSGSAARETFVGTALSLDRGVVITSAGATAALAPAARLSVRVGLERANFNDGNQRDLRSAWARWAVPLGRPRVGLSLSERFVSYDRATGNGYFTPRTLLASLAGADISDRIGSRLHWSLNATWGLQRVLLFGPVSGPEEVADTDTVRGYHAAAAYDVREDLQVEVYTGSTDLAFEAAAGFRTTEAGVRLRWRAPGGPRAARAGAAP
jgi:tetratricopeptide (TPR) repeat protein